MHGALPEDRGVGKLFWIVVGTVVTALIGIPLVYLVDALTPQPSFTFDLMPAESGFFFYLTNVSSVVDVKSPIITVYVRYDLSPQGNIKMYSIDPKCPKYHAEDFGDAKRISFECAFLNRGDFATFISKDGLPPAYISITIAYSGGSVKKDFRRRPPIQDFRRRPPITVLGSDVMSDVNKLAMYDECTPCS
jgi:hypothetical protein